MKKFPILYKKSSKDKISEWLIYANNDRNSASYTTEFGYSDGKKQSTTVNISEGKNIGKANETTPYEQACLEAESKWNKQKDKGYTTSLSLVDAPRISPMLAHKYDDYKHKIKWPCYVQPKLDGLRCLIYRQSCGTIVLQSRQGKQFNSLPHLVEELDRLMFKDGIILDGELYVHGEEFQELIHLIKRDEPHKDSVKIEYHIYDCYDPKNLSWPYKARLAYLENLKLHTSVNSIVKYVKTDILTNESFLLKEKDWAKQNGYEGVMLRNADASYKVGHRSYDLLKVKEFQDDEFEIVGGEENKGRQEGQCSLICKTKEGATFKVKPEGTDEQRQWYWDNLESIIGKMLTVRFFSYTTSKTPVPRFPIGVAIRDYE